MPQLEQRATLSFDRRGTNDGEAGEGAGEGGRGAGSAKTLFFSIDMKEMTDDLRARASNENGVSSFADAREADGEVRIGGGQ